MCSSAGCTQFLHPKLEHDIVEYNHYGPDSDIVDTQAHLKSVQNTLGHSWTLKKNKDGEYVYPSAMMQARSDPICNSSGCTQYLHPEKDDYPKDYFVPDFGLDHDIVTTQSNTANAEADLKHTWTPEEFDKVPQVDAEFKLA